MSFPPALHAGNRLGRVAAAFLLPLLLLAVLIAQLAAAETAVSSVVSATIAVNTTIDELNANSACSLREAIESVNAGSATGGCVISGAGPYVIEVPAGNYFLTRGSNNEDANQGGDLDVRASVTIQGAGMNSTKIDANTLDRIFDLDPTQSTAISVTIADITIQNGRPISGTSGGAILNLDDTLTLLRANVSDSRVFGSSFVNGGGIANGTGTFDGNGVLKIVDSVIEDNASTFGTGGGIYNSGGMVDISGSIIRGNQANVTSGTASGGGISNIGGTINILNSAILDNEVDGQGGGINNGFSSAVMNIANSTISGNLSQGSGGGIRNSGQLSLTNVTIHNNTADADAAFGGLGGGIRNQLGTLYLKGTIVYGNTDVDSPDVDDDVFPDIRDTGTLVSAGYNLIGVITGTTTITDGVNGDLVGVDPDLGALTGALPYYPLALGSPALNVIPAADCTFISGGGNPLFSAGAPVTSDQIGNGRPDPFRTLCDIGAHEPPYRYLSLPIIFKNQE